MGHSGKALQFASERLRADRDVVVAAVRQDWRALEFVHAQFYEDVELLKIGAKQNGHSLGFASEEAKANPELIRIAMDNKWSAIEHAVTPLEVLYSKVIDPKPTRLHWRGITCEFPPRRIKNPVDRPAVSSIVPRSIATFGDALALAAEKQRKL